MWVIFKHFFWTAHRELQETSDLTVEDSGMHHTSIVRNVVAVLKEVLHQEQVMTKKPTIIPEPVDNVENAVQINQQQLVTDLHQIQEMMQTMQIQHAAAPQHAHQYYRSRGYHGGHTNYRG